MAIHPVDEFESACEAAAATDPSPRAGVRRTVCLVALAVLLLWAALLCWYGVSWALHSAPALAQDELANLSWAVQAPYSKILHLLPERIYNDRPLGSALERLLFDHYGFNYRPQLAWFLLLHFAICGMAFAVMRRLGLRTPLTAAAVGLFGVLAGTMQTATYLAASFDVLCTLFLLASVLAILSERKPLWYVSALFYLCALRSKEFGIVTPVLLAGLLALHLWNRFGRRELLREIALRLWPQFIILAVFGARYATLARGLGRDFADGSPYALHLGVGTVLQALSYYTAMIFGLETSYPAMAETITVAALVYAMVRRRGAILFSLGAYVLTLLPVSLLPNIRSPFYVYGPQIFLLLALALCLQDLVDSSLRSVEARWWTAVCLAVAILAAGTAYRKSGHFRARIGFAWMLRGHVATSMKSLREQVPHFGPEAHFYIQRNQEEPWLFNYGDCSYPRIVVRSTSNECIYNRSEAVLLSIYAGDTNEKYLLDYGPRGVLTLRSSAPAQKKPEEAPLTAAEAGLVDDQSALPRFQGAWRDLQRFGHASGGTLTYTDQPGAEAVLAFEGTGITYVFTRAATHGLADVFIDGQRRDTVDQYAPLIGWRAKAVYEGLAPGRHTITIRCLHARSPRSTERPGMGYDVDVDAFIVR